jgi:DNA-binding HxlR family transcriptional regulator
MQDIVSTNPKIEKSPGCVACALENALGGISPRTLSQRLDELEQNKIITKECFAEVPPRVEYTLTQKGKDLIPILKSMAAWGGKYSKL